MPPTTPRPIHLAAIGGSLRTGSVSTRALHACAALARQDGAQVTLLTGADLALPPYDPDSPARTRPALRLASALRSADGVLLGTPTYHGGMSGLLKNALDHAEDLAQDTPAYLEGRPVGCLAVGWNEAAASSALASLRSCAQSLRAWVTPMSAVVPAGTDFDSHDACTDARIARRLEILTAQLLDFARMRAAAPVRDAQRTIPA
jgi:FMN reductase